MDSSLSDALRAMSTVAVTALCHSDGGQWSEVPLPAEPRVVVGLDPPREGALWGPYLDKPRFADSQYSLPCSLRGRNNAASGYWSTLAAYM